MKGLNLLYITLLLFVISCKKDNKEPPSAVISGRIVYQNQALSVRSGGVELELWQYGYQLRNKIPVYVKQDGSFSAKVFGGNYKLTLLRGNGPWADKTDSIDVQGGTSDINVTVDPFFIISNATYTRSNNVVTATFNLQRVNQTRTLEAARLYIGQTTIVDQNNNAANASKPAAQITDLTQPVTITANVPAALQTKASIFVRVGVKTNGVAELVYTIPFELTTK
ncbi:MAG: DUF3823 domain-containing protein [Niastella sp.]|nr:DUF3823 domain-containing protein [Niastella sp.]